MSSHTTISCHFGRTDSVIFSSLSVFRIAIVKKSNPETRLRLCFRIGCDSTTTSKQETQATRFLLKQPSLSLLFPLRYPCPSQLVRHVGTKVKKAILVGVEPSFHISAAHNGETVHFLSRCYAVREVTKTDHSMEVGIEFHASRRRVLSVGARSLDMSRLLALVAHTLA